MTHDSEETRDERDENGAPSEAGATNIAWGIAKVVESPEEAALIVGFLHSNDLPAEIESLHVEELPVTVGGLGEIRVRVPADRLSEALELLERQEHAPPADLEQAALAAQPGSPGERTAEPSEPSEPRDEE